LYFYVRDAGKVLRLREGVFLIVHVLLKGMDITAIQSLLGHGSLRTTQIYAKTDRSKVKREYDLLKL
jgi:site-specific recombinase XerD